MAMVTGSVAGCRATLLVRRNDLYGGVDAFVEDAATAKALQEIGTVDDDDDLKRRALFASYHTDARLAKKPRTKQS